MRENRKRAGKVLVADFRRDIRGSHIREAMPEVPDVLRRVLTFRQK